MCKSDAVLQFSINGLLICLQKNYSLDDAIVIMLHCSNPIFSGRLIQQNAYRLLAAAAVMLYWWVSFCSRCYLCTIAYATTVNVASCIEFGSGKQISVLKKLLAILAPTSGWPNKREWVSDQWGRSVKMAPIRPVFWPASSGKLKWIICCLRKRAANPKSDYCYRLQYE